MPKVWVISCHNEWIVGVCAPNQGAAVSLLHDKECLTDSTFWGNGTLLELYGPDYIDEIAAFSEKDFSNLMYDCDIRIDECDFYGRLP